MWLESRPVVQVVFLLRFWVAVATTAPGRGLTPAELLMTGSCSAVTLSTYLLNGVCDLQEDRANRSGRPLARGDLDRGRTLATAAGLAVTGLILAACTGDPVLLGIVAVCAALGWCSSTGPRPLKRSVAGTVVAASGGGLLTYAAGALSTGDRPAPAPAVAFVLLAGWMAVGGTAKDLGDVVGDRLAGRRTLPVVLGEPAARRTIAIGTGALGLAAGCAALRWSSTAYADWALLVGAGWVARSLLRAPGDGRRGRRGPYRAFMVSQYTANLLLLVHSLL